MLHASFGVRYKCVNSVYYYYFSKLMLCLYICHALAFYVSCKQIALLLLLAINT